jgi:hypothetical protein
MRSITMFEQKCVFTKRAVLIETLTRRLLMSHIRKETRTQIHAVYSNWLEKRLVYTSLPDAFILSKLFALEPNHEITHPQRWYSSKQTTIKKEFLDEIIFLWSTDVVIRGIKEFWRVTIIIRKTFEIEFC